MLCILRTAARRPVSITKCGNKIQIRRFSNESPSVFQKFLASMFFPDKSKFPESGTYQPLPIPHVANGEGGREYSLKHLWENRRTSTYILSLLATVLGTGFILYEYYRFEDNKNEYDLHIPSDLSIFIRGYLRNDKLLKTMVQSVYDAKDEESLTSGAGLLAILTHIIFNDADSHPIIFKHFDFQQLCQVIERNQRNQISSFRKFTPLDVYYIFLAKCAETSTGFRKIVDEGVDEKLFSWFIERPSASLLTILQTLAFHEETRQKMNNKQLLDSLQYFVNENTHVEGIDLTLKTLQNPTNPDWEKPMSMDAHKQTMELNALINGFAWGFVRYFAGYARHIQSSSTALAAIKFSSLGALKTGFYAMAPFVIVVIARYFTFVHYENEKDLNYLIARDQMLQLFVFQASWLLATRTAPFTLAPTVAALVYGAIPDFFPE